MSIQKNYKKCKYSINEFKSKIVKIQIMEFPIKLFLARKIYFSFPYLVY